MESLKQGVVVGGRFLGCGNIFLTYYRYNSVDSTLPLQVQGEHKKCTLLLMSLKKGSTFVKVAHSYGVKETVKNIPYSTRLFKKRLVKFNAPYCCNIGFFRVKIKQLPGAGSPDLFPPQQLGKKTNVLCQIAKIGIPFPFLFSTFFCLFRFCRKINEMFCLDVK